MVTSSLKNVVVILLLSLALWGCQWQDEPVQAPESVAVDFFNYVYNQNDLEKAMALATPKYARILKHYGSSKRVQSVLFNRRYDTVDIQLSKELRFQEGDSASRSQTTVTLLLNGTFAGDRYKDIKYVVLNRHQGQWRVEKLKADPYR